MSRSVYESELVDNGHNGVETYRVERTEIVKHTGNVSHELDGHLTHIPGGNSHGPGYSIHGHKHGESFQQQHHHRLGENAVPALVQAFSGAIGASIANLAVHPLDLIIKRLQVQRQVQNQLRAQRRPRSGLRANSPKYRPSSPSDNIAHQQGGRTPRPRTDSPEHVVLGVGVRDGGSRRPGRHEERITYSHTYSSSTGGEEVYEESSAEFEYLGVVDAAQKIYAQEGLGGFYTGVLEETVGTVGSAFWYFAVYSYLRSKRLRKRHSNRLPVLEELLIGLAAGSVSKFFLTPFNTIATRRQTHTMLYPTAGTPSIVEIYHDIMRQKGITGFWSGYSAGAFLSLNPSITFLLYETLKNFAGGKRRRLKGAETFLLAAVAKAIATGLTYPLAVAKSRTQISNEDDDFSVTSINTLGKAGEELKKRISRKARKSGNIIQVLADIFKREGIGALYEGVLGELLRGFVSSGITMVIKETVHRTILSLYYFVMRAYNRSEDHSFHSTTKLMAKDAYDKAGPRQKKLMNKAIEGVEKVESMASHGKSKVAGLVGAGHVAGKLSEVREKITEHTGIGKHGQESRHNGMKTAAAAAAAASLAAGAVHSHNRNERHDEHGNVIVHTARERVEEWREGVGEDSHRHTGHVSHPGHIIDDRIHTGEMRQEVHETRTHSGSGNVGSHIGRNHNGVTEHTRIEEHVHHGHSGNGSHSRRGSAIAAGVGAVTAGALAHKLSSHSHTEHSHSSHNGHATGIVGAVAGAALGHKLSSHSHNGHGHGGEVITTKVVEEFGIVKDPRTPLIKNHHEGHQAVTDSRARFGEVSHHEHASIHESRGREHGGVVSAVVGAAEKIVSHGHSTHGRSHSGSRHNSSATDLVHKITGTHGQGHGHSTHGRDGQVIVHTTETVKEWRDEANAVEDLRKFGVASTVHEDSRSDFGETLHKGHSIVGHGHTSRFGDDAVVHGNHGHTVVEKTQITTVGEALHDGSHHSRQGHKHNESHGKFVDAALHNDGRRIIEKTQITRIGDGPLDVGHHGHGHRHKDSALHTEGRTVVEKTQITRIGETSHDGHSHKIVPTRSPLRRFEDAAINKVVEKTQVTRFGETRHDAGHQHHRSHSSHSHGRNNGVIGDDNAVTRTTVRETGWLGKKALVNNAASLNTAAATAGTSGVTTVARTEEFWPVDEDARSSVYNFLDEETKEASGGVSVLETRTAEEKWWDDKRGKGYN